MSQPFKPKPDWIRNTGLVSVGYWEPLYFLKYRGGQSTEVEAEYERAHSDDSLDALAAAGINLVWIHYFKGFGLEFEAEEMERAAEYIQRAHARGIKVAAYVTLGSLTPETLLPEEPEAQNWFQVNQDGLPPTCQTTFQCFRVRPCYNAEGYMRYLERVCGAALDAAADMIHFDNLGYNAEPDTCHCPVCVAAFREMLREKYGPHGEETRAAGQARFGHNGFTHLRPPLYNRWNQAVNQRRITVPHQQEWVRFKVRTLTRALERLSSHIQRRNPDCAVEANLFKPFGENTAWLHGIDYAEQLPHLDYAFSEEPHKPGLINAQGAAISRARTFKTARAFDVAIQVYHQDDNERSLELSLAENLAFNPKGLGHFGTPLSGYWAPGQAQRAESEALPRLTKAYVEFYRRHREELLLRTRSLATVGVYRDSASLAWNSVETHLSQLNVEQTLLERNVPFDLLYPNHLADLPRYKAVVLANAECLDDETVARLKAYVEAGGGLLATEQSGAFDGWRRKRPRSALAELFGPEFPGGARQEYGRGRAAYLPRLEHKARPETSPDVWYIFNSYWAPVGNDQELLDALRYAAGGGVPLERPRAEREAAGRGRAHAFRRDGRARPEPGPGGAADSTGGLRPLRGTSAGGPAACAPARLRPAAFRVRPSPRARSVYTGRSAAVCTLQDPVSSGVWAPRATFQVESSRLCFSRARVILISALALSS
ncbi:MAG: beta-galactosidase [Planctomycetota bacterium]|nr:beta-galactosidase [Planctomycetota bacterium]